MAKRRTPELLIIGGPNGSGKSSFAESYFVARRRSKIYINPDVVAAGLSHASSEVAAFQAGRILLTSLKAAIEAQDNVAFESTLSGKTWVPILERAKSAGYRIKIFFILLGSPKLNIKRIEARVKAGGHGIPPRVVLRRYPKSLYNFWNLYRPLADEWLILDNSGRTPKNLMSNKDFFRLSLEEQGEFARSFTLVGIKK